MPSISMRNAKSDNGPDSEKRRLLAASEVMALKKKVHELSCAAVKAMQENEKLRDTCSVDERRIKELEKTLEQVRRRTQWMDPAERLPGYYVPVWGCIDGKRIAVIYRCESDYWRYKANDSYLEEGHKVTAWATIRKPALPKGRRA